MSTEVAPPPQPASGAPGPLPRMPWRRRLVFLGVGVVIAAVVGVGLFTQVGSNSSAGVPRAGDPVPQFSLPALVGTGRVGVPADGGGNGRPAILLFYASWCTECHKEMPALSAIVAHEQSVRSPLTKVRTIGIDGLDPHADAVAYVHQIGATFPIGADTSYTVVSGKFGFTGLPESVFVSAQGTIEAIHYGPLSTSSFLSWQKRLART